MERFVLEKAEKKGWIDAQLFINVDSVYCHHRDRLKVITSWGWTFTFKKDDTDKEVKVWLGYSAGWTPLSRIVTIKYVDD